MSCSNGGYNEWVHCTSAPPSISLLSHICITCVGRLPLHHHHHYHHTSSIASVLPQDSFDGHCLHHDGKAAAGCSTDLAMGTFLLSLLGITVLATPPLPKVSPPQGTVKGCFKLNESESMKEGKVNEGPFKRICTLPFSIQTF